MDRFGPLISPAQLAEHLDDPDLRLIDFRWRLNHDTGLGSSGRPAYERGHIPGAVHIDLEDVSGYEEGRGRHPVPAPHDFQRAMREAGVNSNSRVAVYDDEAGLAASRLWWMLRYFGHWATAVLDGGFQAWPGPLVAGLETPPPGDFTAHPDPARKLDYEHVRQLAGTTVLVDARRRARYVGQAEPADPRAGHIPGALSAYWRDNLRPDGSFKTVEELRAQFQALGIEDATNVVAYCASGVSACHDLLAMEIAGLGEGRLYPGSWSDWSRRLDAPVAVGDESSSP